MKKRTTVTIQYAVELPEMPIASMKQWAKNNIVFMEAEQGIQGIKKLFKPKVQKIEIKEIK